MGWWSEDIMGGDTPLDFQISIYESIGTTWDADAKTKESAFKNASLANLMTLVEDTVKGWGYKHGGHGFMGAASIGWQVLAYEMMTLGVPIAYELKNAMLMYLPKDEWAKDNPIRKNRVDQLIEEVKSYKGHEIYLPQQGLMDKLGVKVCSN